MAAFQQLLNGVVLALLSYEKILQSHGHEEKHTTGQLAVLLMAQILAFQIPGHVLHLLCKPSRGLMASMTWAAMFGNGLQTQKEICDELWVVLGGTRQSK
jgi:hypothetical protein